MNVYLIILNRNHICCCVTEYNPDRIENQYPPFTNTKPFRIDNNNKQEMPELPQPNYPTGESEDKKHETTKAPELSFPDQGFPPLPPGIKPNERPVSKPLPNENTDAFDSTKPPSELSMLTPVPETAVTELPKLTPVPETTVTELPKLTPVPDTAFPELPQLTPVPDTDFPELPMLTPVPETGLPTLTPVPVHQSTELPQLTPVPHSESRDNFGFIPFRKYFFGF